MAIWWGKVSKKSIDALNAVHTKFLKRWLVIPAGSNNAFLYHYTSSVPTSVLFDELMFTRHWYNLRLPHLKGFVLEKPVFGGKIEMSYEKVPSYM